MIEEDAQSLAARLEAERVSLEASLAIGNDALAAAEQVQDEHGKEAAGLHMMELKAKLVALQPQVRFFPSRHPPSNSSTCPPHHQSTHPPPSPFPSDLPGARAAGRVAKARGGRIAAEWFG